MINTKTKGRRIDAIATISYIGSWMPTPAWEAPLARFQVGAEIYEWRASNEMIIPSLHVGQQVRLIAFARENGRLYRVTCTAVEVK